MKLLSLIICLGLVAVVPAAEAKPKLSELIKAGKSTVLVRTVRYAPPFFDFPSSVAGKYALEQGGSTRELLSRFKILDPAFQISDALTKHLVKSFGLVDPGENRVPVKSLEPAQIVAEVGIESGFILDVTNDSWITSQPGEAKNYVLSYKAKLSLIDAATKKVIRSSKFEWSSEGNPYAVRAENNAGVFRKELEEAATASANYFIKKVLSE